MGVLHRFLVGAFLGALAGWSWPRATEHGVNAICESDSLQCLGLVLVAIPATLTAWLFAIWWVLRLARFTPAWPTAMLGPVLIVIVCMLGAPGWFRDQEFVLTAIGAFGYALAAVLTTGYGDRRDREDASLRG